MERSFFEDDLWELRHGAPCLPIFSKAHKMYATNVRSAGTVPSGPIVLPNNQAIRFWRLNWGGVAVPGSIRSVFLGDAGVVAQTNVIATPGIYDSGFALRQRDQQSYLFYGPMPTLYAVSYSSGVLALMGFEVWY